MNQCRDQGREDEEGTEAAGQGRAEERSSGNMSETNEGLGQEAGCWLKGMLK